MIPEKTTIKLAAKHPILQRQKSLLAFVSVVAGTFINRQRKKGKGESDNLF